MEALDELTLRKRRARLLNPITAPYVELEEAMFQYQPAPAIPVAAVPFVFDGVPMDSVEEIRQRAKLDADDVLSKARSTPLAPHAEVSPDLQQGRRDAQFVRDMASFHARPEADDVNRRKRSDLLTREERLDRARQRN